MRIVFILFFSIANILNISAQSNLRKFWGSIELGYGLSIGDYGKYYDISAVWPNSERMSLGIVRAELGYYVHPQFSTGIGIGLNGYDYTVLNTIPIFVNLRYHLKSIRKLFIFTNIGGSVSSTKGGSESSTKGFMTDIGITYKLMIGKNISLNPSLAYNFFHYPDPGFEGEQRSRHTFCFLLGLQF